MKKLLRVLFSFLVILQSITLFPMKTLAVEDGENYMINGDFENPSNPTFGSCNATTVIPTFVTQGVKSGTYSLQVVQSSIYAHVGHPIALVADRTYTFEYDIKVLTDSAGNDISSCAIDTNFVFADNNATNQKKNHVINAKRVSTAEGWVHISGTYSPKSTAIAADANLSGAYFSIYANPVGGRAITFVIDNVVVKRVSDLPADGTNYMKNGDLEDTANLTFSACNNTSANVSITTLDKKSGNASLRVAQTTNYAHVGQAIKLTVDRIYRYEYDVKIISNTDGVAITAASVSTNFVFPDKNSTNQQKNHSISAGSIATAAGWVHVSGTYTPSSSVIAADADLKNAWFSVYVNPVGGKNVIFLLDNISVIRQPIYSFVLPDLISDNMLFQRDKPITLWGNGVASTTLTAKIKNGQTVLANGSSSLTAGQPFEITLPALSAGGSYTLEFSDSFGVVKTINNLLIGDLYHFSGQSNMALTVANTRDYKPEMMPTETIDTIRYFDVADNGTGSWVIAGPTTVPSFSAVAYTTLKRMKDELPDIALGGICTAVPGKTMSHFQGISSAYPSGGSLFQAMFLPISKLHISGNFWYQGESDYNNQNFVDNFKTLIDSWRTLWNNSTLPFYFVQLPQSPATFPNWTSNLDANGMPTQTATFDYTNARKWQDIVYNMMKHDGVGMVVSMDVNENMDPQKSVSNLDGQDVLHPWNKKPIGVRLGNLALADIYGLPIVSQSPRFESVDIHQSTAIVTFSDTYGGLTTDDGLAPRFFQLAGADGVFYPVDSAVITEGNKVSLQSASVPSPEKVYYLQENQWADMSATFVGLDVNLVNSAGLPACPFIASAPKHVQYLSGEEAQGSVPNASFSAGTAFNLPSGTALSKEGYVFYGWKDGNKTYLPGASYNMPDENVTFSAVWLSIETSVYAYTTEFNGNDLEGWTLQKLNPGSASAINNGTLTADSTAGSANDPRLISKNGLDIDASQYSTVKIRMKNTTAGTNGIVRYKRVGDADNIVTCHTAGQVKSFNVSPNSDWVEYRIDMSNSTNWNGTIDRLWIDPVAVGNGAISIDYIRISKPGNISVTYDKNCTDTVAGMPAADQTAGPGTGYLLSAQTPIRAGYTFLGWSQESVSVDAVSALSLTGSDVTVYAIWRNDAQYALRFSANTDSAVQSMPHNRFLITGEAFALDGLSPRRAGYRFLGWSETQDSGEIIPSVTLQEQDKTLYAVWKKTISVHFTDDTGATGTAPETIEEVDGGNIILPNNPFVRKGYTFLGWTDGTNRFQPGAQYTLQSEDTGLSPLWDQNVFGLVGGQLLRGTTAESEHTSLRLLMGVNRTDCSEVGYIISSNSSIDTLEEAAGNANAVVVKSTQVFRKIVAEQNEIMPEAFEGTYILSLKITEIPNRYFENTFYVTCYAKKLDGTVIYDEVKSYCVIDLIGG